MPIETRTVKGEEITLFKLPHPRTALELAEAPYTPAEAICPGLLFRRHVSILAGAPKAGKTTFIRDVLRRMLEARQTTQGLSRSYLRDRFVRGARILVLSEETSSTWQAFAHDLANRLPTKALDHLHILCRDDPGIAPSDPFELRLWAQAIGDHAIVHHYDVVLIDPVSRFGALEDENSSIDVRRAMEAFQQIARRGRCAVLGIHHTAKGGSTPRGSNAWSAEADVLATFEKPTKPEDYDADDCPAADRLRVLSCVGRLETIEPKTLLWLDGEDDYAGTTPDAVSGFRPRVARDGESLLRELRSRPVARVSDLADACNISRRHALRAAYRLAELNAVTLDEEDDEPTISLAFGG